MFLRVNQTDIGDFNYPVLKYNKKGLGVLMRICDISGKKTMHGNNVSHSKKSTKRIWKPNLQTKVITIDGEKVKIRACAKYIKRMNKKASF
tara:strand:+ start:771 stop:1043 length:273 start_codon:yes stop_codon:yes gene_type:complete